MMPIRVIAERLRAQFGRSTVLFTLRSQYSSVTSNYLVLKNNYERLANRKIEPFDAWFAGNLTQVRNLFLRNLDPSHAIDVYRNVFGAGAVHVLPLEIISRHGVKAYLDHLSRISGFEFSSAEIRGYVARNASPPHDIVLDNRQRAVIRRRSSATRWSPSYSICRCAILATHSRTDEPRARSFSNPPVPATISWKWSKFAGLPGASGRPDTFS
jgi:hypothetical protein